MTKPYKIAVTGAGGQIGYALVFRLACGNLLGLNRPINTPSLGGPSSTSCSQGSAKWELEGLCIFYSSRNSLYRRSYRRLCGCRLCLLSRCKTHVVAGMERKDLLGANAQIFSVQGKALNDSASREVRVLVVGNPANTNALIAQQNAPDLSPTNFAAMTQTGP